MWIDENAEKCTGTNYIAFLLLQQPPSNRESPPNTATPGTAIEIDDLEKFVFR